MEAEPHKLYDYDKLIAESDGLYRQWWVMWKRIHPEWAIQKVVVDKPQPYACDKPRISMLNCKRCSHGWTPRSKKKPVQCPKCKSPYWDRIKKV